MLGLNLNQNLKFVLMAWFYFWVSELGHTNELTLISCLSDCLRCFVLSLIGRLKID